MSEPECGTTFNLYIPIYEKEDKMEDKMIVAKTDAATDRDVSKSQRVLLVEDEEMVRKYVFMLLKHYGVEVLEASSPLQALELAEKLDHVDLLFTDVVMPEMNGQELRNNISQKFGDIKTLFMSGYSREMVDDKETMPQNCFFISKPFTMVELKKKLAEILPQKTTNHLE
jgi:CheY-like chemotaxis protein